MRIKVEKQKRDERKEEKDSMPPSAPGESACGRKEVLLRAQDF